MPAPVIPAPTVPESVAILGLGPSLEAYVDIAKRLGGKSVLVDEVWGINSAIDVIRCDRGFHMDDVRVQEARAALNPDTNIAGMLPWLRKHPGPVYTSVPHPEYPGLVAYPLQDVMRSTGNTPYFNSTAAYAVAFALHLGVKKLFLFGMDFSYPNSHKAEKGRACVEFYLGMFKERGGVIGMPNDTMLMDGVATNEGSFYGYDGMKIELNHDGEPVTLKFTPRALPSAEEVERAYDHGRPTVPAHFHGTDASDVQPASIGTAA